MSGLAAKKNQFFPRASVLALVVVSLIVLTTLGVGLLAVAYGVRHQAASFENEAIAMLAAEAAYEKAVFWMSRQEDMLSALQHGVAGTSGTIQFLNSSSDYNIEFYGFIGARPVYRIQTTGSSGVFSRTVDVLVIQAIGGWDMGMCRVPTGTTSTVAVNYVNGEVIDIPLHINKLSDSPDVKDIYISGSPQFLRSIAMGESRYTTAGSDKYSSVMNLFRGGIYFSQPDSKVMDETAIQTKINRFRDSTKTQFKFTPTAGAAVTNPLSAVHIEFFVQGGIGKVRITNNCTVRSNNGGTYDFRIKPGTGGTQYEKYYIYAYHLIPSDADTTGVRFIRNIDETYVSQSIGGVESEPGGQIFVNGNVIIGSGDPNLTGTRNAIKGKITVVATGNIWIADSLVVDGTHTADGKPSKDNPNVLGLMAQSVIKVIDPGKSAVDGTPVQPAGYVYVPVGTNDSGQPATSYRRHLPDPTVVEAALTVGGGGWGAESVGGRKELTSPQDDLIVRGTITEATRGVVGLTGSDGYLKFYYLDERLLEGVLPGDLWLAGKYIAAPAGWHDYR